MAPRDKHIILHGSYEACRLLANILEQYADAAFPPGGSECAQASRDSLRQAAARMLESYDGKSGTARLGRRTRTAAREAIRYYAGQSAVNASRQEVLMNLLSGEVVNDEQLFRAAPDNRL